MDKKIKKYIDLWSEEYLVYAKEHIYSKNPFISLLHSKTDFLENTAKFAYPSKPIKIIYGGK